MDTAKFEDREPIWARMKGFAPWPARFCCAFEFQNLEKKAQHKSTDEVAVVFFGGKNELSWVPAKSIEKFTPTSLTKMMDRKKFKGDKNYKSGVAEAIRISSEYIEEQYPEEFDQIAQDLFKDVNKQDICFECSGTKISGSLLPCANCDVLSIHWHCFLPEDPTANSKGWICDQCCEKNKLPIGTICQYDESTNPTEQDTVESAPTSSNQNPTTPASSKSKKTKEEPTSSKQDKLSHQNSTSTSLPSTDKRRKRGGEVVDIPTTNNIISNGFIDGRISPNTQPATSHLQEDLSDPSDVEDNCFICGQDGELLLCDYPQCTKVYHRVCLLKELPLSMSYPSSSESNLSNLEQTWFCPRHFCLSCGALEQLATSLTGIKLPDQLYLQSEKKILDSTSVCDESSNVKSSPASLNQKKPLCDQLIHQNAIKSCHSCPFSLCIQCEKSNSSMQSCFKSKKTSGFLECVHCRTPSYKMQLAKILEAAWVKMAFSRLSLPFMHPFLPLSDSKSLASSDETPNDLFSIIERIHSLKYQTHHEFINDITSLQCKLQTQLVQYQENQPKAAKDFVLAFESILDSALKYLEGRKVSLLSIEDCLQTQAKISNTLNKDINNSNNNSNRKRRRTSGGSVNEGEDDDEESLPLSPLTWRLFCHYNPIFSKVTLTESNNDNSSLLNIILSDGKTSSSQSSYLIPARSLQSWADFLRQGVDRPVTDFLELQPRIRNKRYEPFDANGLTIAKDVVNRMLHGDASEDMDVEESYEIELASDLIAARAMLGMRDNAQRETVTINPPSSDSQSFYKNFVPTNTGLFDRLSDNYHARSCTDETLVILERLEEITKQTYELQTRLKHEYHMKDQRLVQTSSEVIRLGEVPVITELKLANDNLRWKLQQKDAIISEQRKTIHAMLEKIQRLESSSTSQETSSTLSNSIQNNSSEE